MPGVFWFLIGVLTGVFLWMFYSHWYFRWQDRHLKIRKEDSIEAILDGLEELQKAKTNHPSQHRLRKGEAYDDGEEEAG